MKNKLFRSFQKKSGKNYVTCNNSFKENNIRASEAEYRQACKIFKHLTKRAHSTDSFNKETFLHYFTFNGMLGLRLFDVFDSKRDGKIDLQEFVCGLRVASSGTLEEKCQFCYKLFNLTEDEGVSREDLTVMLSTILYIAFSIQRGLIVPDFVRHTEKLCKNSKEAEQVDHNFSLDDLAKALLKISENCSNIEIEILAEELVSSAFCSSEESKEKLLYPEFLNWLNKNPAVLDFIFCNESFTRHTGLFSEASIKTTWCGYLLKKRRNNPLKKWVWRFFVLKGQFLYYYASEHQTAHPRGAIYLTGSLVDIHERKRVNRTGATDSAETDPQRNSLEKTALEYESYRKHRKNAVSNRRFGVLLEFGNFREIFYASSYVDAKGWTRAIQLHLNLENIKDKYNIYYSKVIGSGGFGMVYQCVHRRTFAKYAVKIVDKNLLNDPERKALVDELAIHKLINHVNIITCYETYETLHQVYIVTELCEGGSVFSLFDEGALSEKRARYLLRQLLLGITYLHRLCIIHRDLKPTNILLSSKDPMTQVVKIADFGYATFARQTERLDLPVGTLSYWPPEIFLEKGYNKPADVWAAGVILYCLVCGKFPFHYKNDRELISRISKGRVNRSCNEHKRLSEGCRNAIEMLLRVKPEARPSAEEALELEWFKEFADV
ncbi:calcium-dependent protein kinase 5-like isoform X2 [Zophobas morio]|uniref:calcium-dependent protein kinase 5-like isoform X2 n=1 Tax=Zophobas morio TaxID=2755281 RepID=UPI0030838991